MGQKSSLEVLPSNIVVGIKLFLYIEMHDFEMRYLLL